MLQTREPRHGLGGALDACCSGKINGFRDNSQIGGLQDLSAICAEGAIRLAAFKLIQAADNIEIGDFSAAEDAIDCASANAKDGRAILRRLWGAS